MLEKLGFEQLVEETLTVRRRTRAMPVYRFVLAMVLALYVGFSRLNHLRFLEREPMLTGILKVLRLQTMRQRVWRIRIGKYRKYDVYRRLAPAASLNRVFPTGFGASLKGRVSASNEPREEISQRIQLADGGGERDCPTASLAGLLLPELCAELRSARPDGPELGRDARARGFRFQRCLSTLIWRRDPDAWPYL
jgi:hypothetical protein